MPKRGLKVAATIVVLALLPCFAGGSAARRAPSISAPPEGDPDASPVFSFCDSIQCACACDDPYDPRMMVDTGDFAGMCLNSCAIRSVVRIPAEEAMERGYFLGPWRSEKDAVYAVNINHSSGESDKEAFFAAKGAHVQPTTLLNAVPCPRDGFGCVIRTGASYYTCPSVRHAAPLISGCWCKILH